MRRNTVQYLHLTHIIQDACDELGATTPYLRLDTSVLPTVGYASSLK